MLLVLPAINVGLIADDFIHRAILTGQTSVAHQGSFFGLFNFTDGQPRHIRQLQATGQVMWWASDAVRMSFWRPLSELTHWMDYRLWPTNPALMHIHSVAWYGLLIVLLGRLYLALGLPPMPTGWAVLIFATSSLHLTAVSWLAARNQLISACFTVLTLMAFHRWRTQQSPVQACLAIVALALGLVSAEAAIATLGYLLAYTLTYEAPRPWQQRLLTLLTLLPFAAIAVAWRLIYNHLGYGSFGSGSYVDPGANLPRFGLSLLVRLPALLLNLVFGMPATLLNKLTQTGQLQYAALACCVIALACIAVQRFKLWADTQVRFLGLGTLLALVPACAAQPSERLLLNAEIGASALLALLIDRAFARHRLDKGWRAGGAKLLVGLIMVVHLIVFPIQTLVFSSLMNRLVIPATMNEPLSLPDFARAANVHVILLNPPVASMAYYYPLVRASRGLGNPASMQALASGDQDLTLSVIDDTSFTLEGPKGFMDSIGRDIVAQPFKVGDVIDIGTADVRVIRVTREGVPLKVMFHFHASLHDGLWRFYVWRDDGFVPLQLPTPQHTIVLPEIDMGRLMMRRLQSTQ